MKYDIQAEQSVLAGIIKHGVQVYFDVADFLSESDFHAPNHRLLYSAIAQSIEAGHKLDDSILLVELSKTDKKGDVKQELLNTLRKINIAPDSVSTLAKRIARAALINKLDFNLDEAKDSLAKTQLDKPILDIFKETENIVFSFADSVLNNEAEISLVGNNVGTLIDYLATEKPDIFGISTGFKHFDLAIGGGLRAGVNVIGARAKNLKTTLALNVINNVANNMYPVLFLDTEMSENDLTVKLLAMNSDLEIGEIESGRFADNPTLKARVKDSGKMIKDCKYHYKNVAGMPHQQIISIARRWIHRIVGFNANGQTNPCLIVLDYIKTMDLGELGDIQEYQYLGQYVTDLHNLTVKYKVPVLAMVQLNRDGIEKENSGAISGSDRILWLCTSFSILKRKSEEDLISDPIENGDRKLIPLDCRYGPGMEQGEYINLFATPAKAQIKEGKKSSEIKFNKPLKDSVAKQPRQPKAKKDSVDSPSPDTSLVF